jgi:hypothetical protein
MASVLARFVPRRHVLATLGLALLATWYFAPIRVYHNHLGDAESIALSYYFLGLSCLLGPFRKLKVTDGGGALMACPCWQGAGGLHT